MSRSLCVPKQWALSLHYSDELTWFLCVVDFQSLKIFPFSQGEDRSVYSVFLKKWPLEVPTCLFKCLWDYLTSNSTKLKCPRSSYTLNRRDSFIDIWHNKCPVFRKRQVYFPIQRVSPSIWYDKCCSWLVSLPEIICQNPFHESI